MKRIEFVKRHRPILTILLALSGIVTMAYYDYCDTACTYLKGDLLGIDLKWVGITYISVIIVFAAFRQMNFVRALLAAGLGVEVHLYAFQVRNDVYCPFCLAFSVILILAFIINYEIPSAWRGNRNRMWLYFLGEVSFPMLKLNKLPLLLFSVLGYLTILLTFSGSVTPSFAQTTDKLIPSLGKGPHEIILFADYFCPPCYRIDTKADPLLKELFATGKVKITFADVPYHKETPMYVKYYLYAANANAGAENIFQVRKLLFEAAQVKRIEKEEELLNFLKEKKIKLKPFEHRPVFEKLTALTRQHNVRGTPTCVIKYSGQDTKTFVGDIEIWNGLTKFKTDLTNVQK